ncbi:MAG: VRR-NUC domain-containing protein [Bullifex sp.]
MAEEKLFESKVKKLLTDRGAWVLKTWGGGFQRSGVPDLLVCYKGKFFGVELKSDKGKTSPLQELELKMINKAGGVGIVLRPSKLDCFVRLLDYLDEGA